MNKNMKKKMTQNCYCSQCKETYVGMQEFDFDYIAKKLGFKEVMCKWENTQRPDKAIRKTKLFVLQEHSYILYAIFINEELALATLYAQVYFDGGLTESQSDALRGSGYQIIDTDKIYFGFSVTKGLYSKTRNIMYEFTPIKKWTNLDKVCLGFIDNTFENNCGRGTGFTKNELKQNSLVANIIF